jgi:hypothetical protein
MNTLRECRIQHMSNPNLGVFREAPTRIETAGILREEEYMEYRNSVSLIEGVLSDYLQFQMVRNSYAEYRRLIDRYKQKYSVKPQINSVVVGRMNHEINRRLRGFFTEFFFFLEYAERKLKRQYGKESQQAQDFKQATSEQFDSSFAYRFVYQLRHYAQHINLPLNALSLKSGEFDFLLATTRHNLLVEVNRDILLNSGFDWRAKDVRPQLSSLPPKFELNGYIEEMMECLEKIHVAFFCISLPDAKRAADYVKELIKPVVGKGKPVVYHSDYPDRAVKGEIYSNIASSLSWVPVELAEFIADLPAPAVLRENPSLNYNFHSGG